MLGWGSLANGSIDDCCFVVSKRLDLTDLLLSSSQLPGSDSERILCSSLLAVGGLVLLLERINLSRSGLELPLGLLDSLFAAQEGRMGRDQLLQRDPSVLSCLLGLVLGLALLEPRRALPLADKLLQAVHLGGQRTLE